MILAIHALPGFLFGSISDLPYKIYICMESFSCIDIYCCTFLEHFVIGFLLFSVSIGGSTLFTHKRV